jgi:hypothetical protein
MMRLVATVNDGGARNRGLGGRGDAGLRAFVLHAQRFAPLTIAVMP